MNKKYTYQFTVKEDYNIPNNNYGEMTENLVTDGIYDFGDFLSDSGVKFYHNVATDTYYVLDNFGERTGSAYQILSVVDTTENLSYDD